jgi:hypothetical protein
MAREAATTNSTTKAKANTTTKGTTTAKDSKTLSVTKKTTSAKKTSVATEANSKAEKTVGAVTEKVQDPFKRLPNECYGIILSSLSPIDLVRCELVTPSWRDHIRSWISLSSICIHFPYAWETQNWDRKGPVYDQFKRLGKARTPFTRVGVDAVLI